MIRTAISKLVEGHPISGAEAQSAMEQIMAGEATDAQIAAYLVALRIRGETPEVIAGSARAMRQRFTRVPTIDDVVVDTCGTGGDGSHTINISTGAAFVAAGAGVTVAKHGNRSVSSRSGSADVLESLGVNISVSPEIMAQCLKQIGLAFLFAPSLHPAMKHAIGPRRELGLRTIFNILGPLSNPAEAQHGVLGVYSESLVDIITEAAADLGFRHFFVVHGNDGLDEITNTTTSHIGEVHDGEVRRYDFDPTDHGFTLAQPDELRGGEPAENAQALRSVLEGHTGPHRDIIVLNAAAAILAGGRADDFAGGIAAAIESVDSGAALEKLNALVALTSTS